MQHPWQITVEIHQGRDLPEPYSLRVALLGEALAHHQPLGCPSKASNGGTAPATVNSTVSKSHVFQFVWPDMTSPRPILSVELWDSSKSYDEFVCVAQRPCDAALPPTWWELPRRHHTQPALLISVAIEAPQTPCPSSEPSPPLEFTFKVPCDRINWRALHAVNIGAVVHKKKVDVLEGLMDVTLHGDADSEDGNNLTAALVLLQFSCQYAAFCRNELSRRATAMQADLDTRAAAKESLVRRRGRLMEKRQMYQRESSTLDDRVASLKGLLHNDHPPRHPTSLTE